LNWEDGLFEFAGDPSSELNGAFCGLRAKRSTSQTWSPSQQKFSGGFQWTRGTEPTDMNIVGESEERVGENASVDYRMCEDSARMKLGLGSPLLHIQGPSDRVDRLDGAKVLAVREVE